MSLALDEAKLSAIRGEVPVGAIIVNSQDNMVIARSGNKVEELKDPTAHAEILVIREATRLLGTRIQSCDLYVTLEPCSMCASAASLARIRRLYYGAYDIKSGGVDHGARIFNHSNCHHKPEVYGGIKEETSRQLLKKFFANRR
ncbi:MAG: tRNA-specific adenosine deaminase [Rhodospirillaceae bacterium]|nr:tRNA-specific adenosine deaminase [Rhodospirillaceae bacterium]OUT80942.1 MAG: tRNA-specific adenosine deaminase [Rhodospirillaceae bacterium TMED23]